jgi:hypothetical protein
LRALRGRSTAARHRWGGGGQWAAVGRQCRRWWVACEGRGGEPEVRGKPEEGRWRLADDMSVGARRKT